MIYHLEISYHAKYEPSRMNNEGVMTVLVGEGGGPKAIGLRGKKYQGGIWG